MTDTQPYTEYLHDKLSNENFQKLLKEYSNRKPFIVFIGAGLSKIPGLPSWDELLKKLCNAGSLKYSNLTGKYWDKASQIEESFNSNPNNMYDVLRNILDPIQTSATHLHHLLLGSKFNSIITTNYDDVLRSLNSKNRFNCEVQIFPDLNPTRLTQKEIIYFHGNIYESDDIIFTKAQYDEAYINNYENLKDLLELAYWHNSIVFIGFSFDDEYFKSLYNRVKKETKKYTGNVRDKAPPDYIIFDVPYTDDSEIDTVEYDIRIKDFGEELELNTIAYLRKRGGYINLEKLFQVLVNSIPDEIQLQAEFR